MLKNFYLIVTLLFLFSCSHVPMARKVAQNSEADLPKSDLTVWSLKEMAQKKQFDELNDLYNHHSLPLEALPVGYAAGAGTKVFNAKGLILKALDAVVGDMWKGKIFFTSENKLVSRGMNRIKALDKHIVPMANFVTKIVPEHTLVPDVDKGRSIVLLNYAHPAMRDDPFIQEELLRKIQVYDLMVAVPGKYGPVFIGKTWLGKYDKKDGEFKAFDKDKLIAWYFLDFNPAALEEQERNHSDGSVEVMMDPIAHVSETDVPY